MPRPESRTFVIETLARVNWDGPVIDLGAGDVWNFYRNAFTGKEYYTLDLKQNKNNDIAILADMVTMPAVASNRFGVVLMLETLEHVRHPFKAFEEAARILRPGGLFICTTVACWEQHDHPADYWRFLPKGLEVLCKCANLMPFSTKFDGVSACIPSHSMVAAIK